MSKYNKRIVRIGLISVLIICASILYLQCMDLVVVRIPSCAVTVNDLVFDDNSHTEYPVISYRGVKYFPLTDTWVNVLNIEFSETDDEVRIENGNSREGKVFSRPSMDKWNGFLSTASPVGKRLILNGKSIETSKSKYPLLYFRSKVYFPLTEQLACEELGEKYEFNRKIGLAIYTDSFFYTMNGDSYAKDGLFSDVPNETHYICGDVHVHMTTQTQRLIGPVYCNLQIINGVNEIRPEGYFGYYQKNGPLFTVEDGFINTVYYTDPDKRDVRPCKVRISDGEIIEDVQLFHE